MDTYTIEKHTRVYDDHSGEYIYIGPDGDGLELVELRYYNSDGTISHRFPALPKEMMLLVAKAIQELYSENK